MSCNMRSKNFFCGYGIVIQLDICKRQFSNNLLCNVCIVKYNAVAVHIRNVSSCELNKPQELPHSATLSDMLLSQEHALQPLADKELFE